MAKRVNPEQYKRRNQLFGLQGYRSEEEAKNRFQEDQMRDFMSLPNVMSEDENTLRPLTDFFALTTNRQTGELEMVKLFNTAASTGKAGNDMDFLGISETNQERLRRYNPDTLNAMADEGIHNLITTQQNQGNIIPVKRLDYEGRSAASILQRELFKRSFLENSPGVVALGGAGKREWLPRTGAEHELLKDAYLGDIVEGVDRLTGAPLGKVHFVQAGSGLYYPIRAALQGGHVIRAADIKADPAKYGNGSRFAGLKLVNAVENQRLQNAFANLSSRDVSADRATAAETKGRYDPLIRHMHSEGPVFKEDLANHLDYLLTRREEFKDNSLVNDYITRLINTR